MLQGKDILVSVRSGLTEPGFGVGQGLGATVPKFSFQRVSLAMPENGQKELKGLPPTIL